MLSEECRPFGRDSSFANAAVYDIGKNLTIDGNMISDYGAFVKTGAGTLTMKGKFLLAQCMGNGQSRKIGNNILAFSNDGETASQGYGCVFTLADGAVVITNASDSTESKFGQVNYDGIVMGCWTAASGEVEKDVLFDLKRGKVTATSITLIGRQHGFVNNTVEGRPAKATFRISGGTYTQAGGKAIVFGGGAHGGMGRRRGRRHFRGEGGQLAGRRHTGVQRGAVHVEVRRGRRYGDVCGRDAASGTSVRVAGRVHAREGRRGRGAHGVDGRDRRCGMERGAHVHGRGTDGVQRRADMDGAGQSDACVRGCDDGI